MNIVLIGGRGSGKTTISKVLAKKTGKKLFSTDDLICYEEQETNISEIVRKKGWFYFRDLEYRVLEKVTKLKEIIIDCGGGAITDLDSKGTQIYSQRKVEILKKSSLVIWLKISPEIACERIGKDSDRPSLSGVKNSLAELKDILVLRNPWYQKVADYVFDTGKLNVLEVALGINKIINQSKDL